MENRKFNFLEILSVLNNAVIQAELTIIKQLFIFLMSCKREDLSYKHLSYKSFLAFPYKLCILYLTGKSSTAPLAQLLVFKKITCTHTRTIVQDMESQQLPKTKCFHSTFILQLYNTVWRFGLVPLPSTPIHPGNRLLHPLDANFCVRNGQYK